MSTSIVCVRSYDRPLPTVERYSGYRRLWIKVIVRAIYDYALWKDVRDVKKKHDAQKVYRWLFEPSDYMFSLENICQMASSPDMEISIEAVRNFAKIATRADVKKLEHIERERGKFTDNPKCLANPRLLGHNGPNGTSK